jgi:thymidylate kinase
MRNLHGLTVAFAQCYADHAGGGRYLPRQEACSVPEREQALRELLRVEADRLARLPSDRDLILADRSVHTLLAHSYALEQMTGLGMFEPSVRLLRASPLAAWPDLVMYLDLPQEAVEGRNNGKFPPGSIYTDPAFNTAIRSYFLRLAGQNTPRLAWLDATLDLPELARLAEAQLRQMVWDRDVEGAV